jgi:hypothetical protein
MDVLGDLVARERRTDQPLVRFDEGPSGAYTAHKFCTDAWKTASLFRYNGVGPGRTVAIADDHDPPALLSLFGAALLGAQVRFGPDRDAELTDRLLVADADDIGDWDVAPGTKRVAYNGPPDDPSVAHFERDIWSENPTMPPDGPDPDEDVLVTDEQSYTHATLLAAADDVVDDAGLTDEDVVALRASLTDPGAVVAGVLAPIAVGATILLPSDGLTGTVAVTDGDAPESRVIGLPDVR